MPPALVIMCSLEFVSCTFEGLLLHKNRTKIGVLEVLMKVGGATAQDLASICSQQHQA